MCLCVVVIIVVVIDVVAIVVVVAYYLCVGVLSLWVAGCVFYLLCYKLSSILLIIFLLLLLLCCCSWLYLLSVDFSELSYC